MAQEDARNVSSLRTADVVRAARQGPWPWLDWKFSLIFPVALLLFLVTLLVGGANDRKLLELQVRNVVTGDVVPGAQVSILDHTYTADDAGTVVIERPADGTEIAVHSDGFGTVIGEVANDSSGTQSVHLKPSTLAGVLTDQDTREPIAGAEITLLRPDGTPVASTKTDSSGAYTFRDTPDNARIAIAAGPYGAAEHDVAGKNQFDLALVRSIANGLVQDDEGQPLQGAVVQTGDVRAVTGADGAYTLEGVGNGAEVAISASGYETVTAKVADGMVGSVKLQPQLIKGVYASWSLLADPGGLDSLIEIANTTEINAIVIDIKQDTVYYDSKVQFFHDAGTVAPIYDAEAVLKKLEENNIYAIARLVVFQDPLVAEARPDLAVLDSGGGLWRNELGIGWVNAFNEELWHANIELAVEAIDIGFDEIQYDYVRFPSDGDLSTAEFGQEYTAEAREAAITGFMRESYDAIHDAGGKLAADLFGFITIVDDEQYIGQRFSKLEPYLDYVCMMIYPSHFSEGNIATADGHPNDFPYETIYESLGRAEQIVPGASAKFRPWLQDFSYGNMREYGPADVRAQIDAAEEYGASGWMLWGDPFNITVEALEPASPGT
ncbi:MAG TPA: putative glycoside hydrolase [Thermomicrobiales bacterium]|nr:putative glycoside hydrolase [Thermomicrobiales bacterium]